MHDLSLGVAAAIQHFKTRTAIAKQLGITRSAVCQWKSVPIEHVLKLEAASDGALRRQSLRPDMYPPEAA